MTTPRETPPQPGKWEAIAVWVLRVAIGATFVMSGFVKMIDLWGFIFKLEEYLAIWHISQPRTIVFMMALLVSGYEFVLGALMMMGCYKRTTAWGLTLMMMVMLPLTAWIWITDPVSDCGCFGEFWVISNGATFAKNLVITAALVYLIARSHRVKMALFNPSIQWVVGAWLSLYIICIGLYGYNIQPMLDFRSFPIGGAPVASSITDGNDDADEAFEFIYEKDGQRKTFSIDNLPDSSWTFIDRAPADDAEPLSELAASSGDLAVFDADGNDVTSEVIIPDGEELILVIPEPVRADISFTYSINEMYEYADSIGIPMVALLGTDARGVERWIDWAMAEYPCYTADDTQLKELARGTMSVVFLKDGIPAAKISVGAIDPASIENPSGREAFLDTFADNGRRVLMWLNIIFGGVLLLLYLFQGIILAVRLKLLKKYRLKHRKNA